MYSPRTINFNYEIMILASTARVWGSLLTIGEWWPHRQNTGGALAMEPWIGGRLIETWENGGALWSTINHLEEEYEIVLAGQMALGGPVCGTWSCRLAGEELGSTLVTSTHIAFGLIGEENERFYRDGGWDLALAALKNHAEMPA